MTLFSDTSVATSHPMFLICGLFVIRHAEGRPFLVMCDHTEILAARLLLFLSPLLHLGTFSSLTLHTVPPRTACFFHSHTTLSRSHCSSRLSSFLHNLHLSPSPFSHPLRCTPWFLNTTAPCFNPPRTSRHQLAPCPLTCLSQ